MVASLAQGLKAAEAKAQAGLVQVESLERRELEERELEVALMGREWEALREAERREALGGEQWAAWSKLQKEERGSRAAAVALVESVGRQALAVSVAEEAAAMDQVRVMELEQQLAMVQAEAVAEQRELRAELGRRSQWAGVCRQLEEEEVMARLAVGSEECASLLMLVSASAHKL